MSLNKIYGKAALCAYLLFLIVAVWAFYAYTTLPSADLDSQGAYEELSWPAYVFENPEVEWRMFRPLRGDGPVARTGQISAKYRLAGTFLEYGDPASGTDPSRRAILDDLERGLQAMVIEGDLYEDVRVVRVSRDYVVLEKDSRTEELWIGFDARRPALDQETDDVGERDVVSSDIDEPSRFGRRVGENRWVFEKDKLREFYMEMMDNPQRAVEVYETMRPNYDEDMNIRGYVVDIVGEADFFEAVGLRDGDIVKSVNSLKMSSRLRAEYFIREFMQDRVNALVLEVERGGEEHKQIYLLR